jgi:hypothetical protein
VASLNGLAFIPARYCADSLLLSSPTEGGFDRRLRTEDRRQRLVLFPASAKGLVQDHWPSGYLSGACRGLWISWKDWDGREQRGFVRHADLVGEGVDWLKDIIDRGFSGPIVRKRIVWLRLALHGCRPSNRIRMLRRTGWVGSAFVLPHRTIGTIQGKTIMYDGRSDIARYDTLSDSEAF